MISISTSGKVRHETGKWESQQRVHSHMSCHWASRASSGTHPELSHPRVGKLDYSSTNSHPSSIEHYSWGISSLACSSTQGTSQRYPSGQRAPQNVRENHQHLRTETPPASATTGQGICSTSCCTSPGGICDLSTIPSIS